ncbi:MAG: HAD family hydrolase [Calditrichaeota bacterium]|nr:HAD family hydrolase [Calditrichota bacterium]
MGTQVLRPLLSQPYEGLIFDVLYTLVDDAGFPRDVIVRFLEESGVRVNREAYNQEYDAYRKTLFDWSAIRPFVRVWELHRRRLQHFYNLYSVERNIEKDLSRLWEYMGTSHIYPDAAEVLPQLKKRFKMGILSNADKDDPLIRKLIGRGFEFDVILTSEEAGCYKPDRRIFEIMGEKMGLPADKLLMIGDSPEADITGAHRAGMDVAWINRDGKKLPPRVKPPTYEFANLKDLAAFLIG